MDDSAPIPCQAYLVSADGSRTAVTAQKLVVEVGPGRKVVIDLDHHRKHPGYLVVKADESEDKTKYAVLVLKPAAGNCVYVTVECPSGYWLPKKS